MAKEKKVNGYRWHHICNTHHVSIATQPDASSERVAVDATAKRFCDACNLLIHIGSGGEANWKMHESSKKHQALDWVNRTQPSLASYLADKRS
jgi:hypothetical protein